MVPIEQIRVGDIVLAHNPETGETLPKEVTTLFVNDAGSVWELTIESEDGATELHRVTDNHPYWVEGSGWVEVKDLQPGMKIATEDGDTVTLDNIFDTGVVERTFNFEVADFHTYFVGNQKVLVHNCNKIKLKAANDNDKFAGRREPKSLQDQMTLDAAKKGEGDTIISADKIKDPKFKGMEKAQLKTTSDSGKKSVVNFMRKPGSKEGADFKFKKRSDE